MTKTVDETARRAALVAFLDVLPPDVRATAPGANTFFIHDHDYYAQTWLVLTDEEADALAREAALRDAWTCNTFFLRAHVAPALAATFEAFEPSRERLCERANPILLTMIADHEAFAIDVTGTDGRGHFLSPVNGAEHHAEGLYLYRQS
jgi:hypothetical protein